MSGAQNAARLVSLAVAHDDAAETLLERTIADTATDWDARAVRTAFDAMNATPHALKITHYPDARAVCSSTSVASSSSTATGASSASPPTTKPERAGVTDVTPEPAPSTGRHDHDDHHHIRGGCALAACPGA